MAKQREIDLSDKTEAASPTEPSSKRKKRSPRPAEHFKTLAELWLVATAPGETRKIYTFLNRGTATFIKTEYILAPSEQSAQLKWMEVTKQPLLAVMGRRELMQAMMAQIGQMATTTLEARNGNPSHDEPPGLAAGSPDPEPRTSLPAGRGKGSNSDVPF